MILQLIQADALIIRIGQPSTPAYQTLEPVATYPENASDPTLIGEINIMDSFCFKLDLKLFFFGGAGGFKAVGNWYRPYILWSLLLFIAQDYPRVPDKKIIIYRRYTFYFVHNKTVFNFTIPVLHAKSGKKMEARLSFKAT